MADRIVVDLEKDKKLENCNKRVNNNSIKYSIDSENKKEKAANKDTKPDISTGNIESSAQVKTEVDVPMIIAPLDDKDLGWGNDSNVDSQIDKQFLTEKKIFMRVRYIKNISCKLISSVSDKIPHELNQALTFMTCDISVKGIVAVFDYPVEKDTVLYFKMILDQMEYYVEYTVAYCVRNDEKYRIGLKLHNKDKNFIRHLKLFVARVSLETLSEEEENLKTNDSTEGKEGRINKNFNPTRI